MTRRGPGLHESQEPCITVAGRPNSRLRFDGDNGDPSAPERVRRLGRLLEEFPLPSRHEQRMHRAPRSERMVLADVARHVWGLGMQEETPVEHMSDRKLRRFVRQFGLLPRWFGPPRFLASGVHLRVVMAQSRLVRQIDPPGLDLDALCARLTRLGLTSQVVERDVDYEAEWVPAFPVVVESFELSASEQDTLRQLSSALMSLQRTVSLADIEQVLLDLKRDDPAVLRSYIA